MKIGYSAGNLGKSIVWASFESFLLFYLVTIAGMSPMLAGGVLAMMMVWDGTADILVSWWADRYGPANILSRLISWGAPLCAISFGLIFALPQETGRWLMIGAIVLCRLGYTLCDVGHNTLLVRVAATPRDGSVVSGLRLIFSAIGGGLVGLAAAHILAIADRHAQERAFALFAVLGGLLYLACLTGARLVTRHLPAAATSNDARRSGDLWLALWRNRAFRRVLLLIALQSCLVPLFGRALPFFGLVHFGDAAWAGRALSIITMMQALSLLMWMRLSRHWSQSRILICAHLFMALALVGMMKVQAAEGALAVAALIGVAQGGMNMAIWALLAGSVRSAGPALAEALPVGAFLATLKYASGLGNMLLGSVIAVQGPVCMVCDDISLRAFNLTTLCLPLVGSLTIALIGWRTPE
ncbi:MAG: MFS transporter [Novosphingobium sp.]